MNSVECIYVFIKVYVHTHTHIYVYISYIYVYVCMCMLSSDPEMSQYKEGCRAKSPFLHGDHGHSFCTGVVSKDDLSPVFPLCQGFTENTQTHKHIHKGVSQQQGKWHDSASSTSDPRDEPPGYEEPYNI